jgi:hypothetical protein
MKSPQGRTQGRQFLLNLLSLFSKLHGIICQLTAPITVIAVRTSNLTKYHSISTTPLQLHTTLYMAGIVTRVTRHFILKANTWEILITKLILNMLYTCIVSCWDYTATVTDEWTSVGATVEWYWQECNWRTQRKTCLTATLFTINPTYFDQTRWSVTYVK